MPTWSRSDHVSSQAAGSLPSVEPAPPTVPHKKGIKNPHPRARYVSSCSQGARCRAPEVTPRGRCLTPASPRPGACSVKESDEEVTYQGCTANITVTRCKGVCTSSAR